jgi:hypothetical protein
MWFLGDENIIGIKGFGKMKTWLSKTGDDTIDIETFENNIKLYRII